MTTDSAPAERNKGPILEILRQVLPERGLVLELASGTGQHVLHFAAALPALRWQPTDADPESSRHIAARCAASGLANVAAPVQLDVRSIPWSVPRADALVCINMIHIAPWEAALALFVGAADVLPEEGAPVCLYGPYRRGGAHTAPSNAAFDASLRARDASWGVRDLEEVERVARREGFGPAEVWEMPANNFTVVFRRLASSARARVSSE